VVYIALGEKAQAEQRLSAKGLDLPVKILTDPSIKLSGYPPLGKTDFVWGSRALKTKLYWLTPFDQTLYLDADTRVLGDISAGFKILDGGWDIAMAFSDHQGDDSYWHLSGDEKLETRIAWAGLQWQCGVMFFQKNNRVERLWNFWREEWERWQGQDQGAFARALARCPLKIWCLGKAWNNGIIVQHKFGFLR
jgi:hypothetical protein